MNRLNVLIFDEIQAENMLEQMLLGHGYEVACLALKNLDIGAMIKTLLPDVIVLNLYSPGPKILATILD